MIGQSDSPQDNFNRLYTDVSRSIDSATAEIDKLEMEHHHGKKELNDILARLRDMQARFDDELGLLEKHSEWEKFTIAFFGETNAGKSTIIESLRILFDEETRRELLDRNARDLVAYEQDLRRHVDAVRHGLLRAHAAFLAEIATVRTATVAHTDTLLKQSAARHAAIKEEVATMKHALHEASVRSTGLEETLAQSRGEQLLRAKSFDEQIAQVQQDRVATQTRFDAALKRAVRHAWISAASVCILGAAVVSAVASLWK